MAAEVNPTTPPEDFNIIHPDGYAQYGYPHHIWSRLRAEDPVHWWDDTAGLPFWAITKHADIMEISKRPDVFISAPRINSPICGGNGVITGNFSVIQTQELALLLRAGALPVPLTVVEERTVGPTLGADSIQAGKIAAGIGFAMGIVFMVICYGRFGMVANVALFTNLVLIMGALSMLQATLTLPGIAGIVLTVGMAVDANVLIFERIREEVRNGRTPFNAVESGFKRAMTTILDANITTALAAFLLFFLGSGPVKGFGATLAIGIVTSMFTAIMLTRMICVLWLRRSRPAQLPI